jgi:hypothetical protein
VVGEPGFRHLAKGFGSIRRCAALMFYPEANVLMHAVVDPASGTPAFKRVPVLVRGAALAG